MKRSSTFLAILAAAVLVPACGGGGSGGGGLAPFQVTQRAPDSSPSITPLQTEIYVRFNRDFDQATVTASSFTVTSVGGTVTGTFQFTHALNEIRFLPSSALTASTVYTVTLTSAVEDTLGNPLQAGFFTFTTGAPADSTRPTFAGVTGINTPALTTLNLTWAAATDASAVTYEVFLSFTSGVFDYLDPYTTTASGTGMTVTGLASDTTYYFSVRAWDAAGNTDLNTAQVTAKTLTSFATDVFAGIMQSKCRSCHSPGGEGYTAVPTMNFFNAANARTTLVNVAITAAPLTGAPMGAMRVVPSDVALSFLHNKIQSKVNSTTPWGGVAMPKSGNISQAEVDTIAAWIAEGALNN